MLTLQQLKDMAPGTVFASGETVDSSEGINFDNTGASLRWVAVRGSIHDWAIYADLFYKEEAEVRDMGNKVFNRETIKKLVPCDNEALEMYRD